MIEHEDEDDNGLILGTLKVYSNHLINKNGDDNDEDDEGEYLLLSFFPILKMNTNNQLESVNQQKKHFTSSMETFANQKSTE